MIFFQLISFLLKFGYWFGVVRNSPSRIIKKFPHTIDKIRSCCNPEEEQRMLKHVKDYLIFAHFGKVWVRSIRTESIKDLDGLESFAVLAKLYDELSDSFSLTNHQILDENYALNIPEKKLFLLCMKECKNKIGGNEKWKRIVNNVINPQIASLKQISGSESEISIEQITKNKGGSAVFFTFSAYLNLELEKDSFFFHFGYFLQLVDDYFDGYFDAQDNIQTLFSPINHIDKSFNYIEDQFKVLKEYTEFKNIGDFKFIVYLLYVLSKTARVHFYSLNSKKSAINFKNISRKQGVVDLEKWRLRLVFIQQFYKNKTKLGF